MIEYVEETGRERGRQALAEFELPHHVQIEIPPVLPAQHAAAAGLIATDLDRSERVVNGVGICEQVNPAATPARIARNAHPGCAFPRHSEMWAVPERLLGDQDRVRATAAVALSELLARAIRHLQRKTAVGREDG